MKKRSSVSFGPGASSLILIFVVLAMSVLGVLALMNSRNDLRLSERSALVAQEAYAFSGRMEEKRAALDAVFASAAKDAADDEAYLAAVEAALPGDVNLYGREISWIALDSWEGANGLRQLSCALELLPLGSNPRARWTRHELAAVTDDAVLALQERVDSKREALSQIVSAAAGQATDEASFAAAVESALPADLKLENGLVRFTEYSSANETDLPQQLSCALTLPVFGAEDLSPAWVSRTVTEVTDEDVLLLMDQADDSMAALNVALVGALQQAVAEAGNDVAAVSAAYRQALAANLPEGATLTGNVISWVEATSSHQLQCAAALQPLGASRLALWASRGLIE